MTTSLQLTISNDQFTMKKEVNHNRFFGAKQLPSLKIENCRMKILSDKKEDK